MMLLPLVAAAIWTSTSTANPPPIPGAQEDAHRVPTMVRHRCCLRMIPTIWFERNRDIIKPVNYLLLDEIGRVLREKGDIKRVRIEGYTDNTERDPDELSRRRAAAVMAYLTDRQVDSGRLVLVGFGSRCPHEPNRSPDSRANNRRVDVTILERDGVVLDAPRCRDAASETGLRFKAPGSGAPSPSSSEPCSLFP